MLSAALAAAVAASPEPAAPDPAAIYERARTVAAARVDPAYLAYDIHVAFARKGHTERSHAHVLVRTRDGKAVTTELPDGPRDRVDATPHVASRVPYVWPFATWGVRPNAPAQPVSSYDPDSTPQPEPSGLAAIGRVRATALRYDLTYLGRETIDGRPADHLRLVPRFDPDHNQLRELFVDQASGQTVRIVMMAHVHAGPIYRTPLATFDYVPVGNSYRISTGRVAVTLRALFVGVSAAGTLAIDHVEIPATPPPDSVFGGP